MFDGYLEARRSPWRGLPRGALAGAGGMLAVGGRCLAELVGWRLRHPPGFFDLEGSLLAAVFGTGALAMMVMGGLLVGLDAVLWVTGRRVRPPTLTLPPLRGGRG